MRSEQSPAGVAKRLVAHKTRVVRTGVRHVNLLELGVTCSGDTLVQLTSKELYKLASKLYELRNRAKQLAKAKNAFKEITRKKPGGKKKRVGTPGIPVAVSPANPDPSAAETTVVAPAVEAKAALAAGSDAAPAQELVAAGADAK